MPEPPPGADDERAEWIQGFKILVAELEAKKAIIERLRREMASWPALSENQELPWND